MPSKTKSQQRFFKLVHSYKMNGRPAVSFLPDTFQDRIIQTAKKISDKDLVDMMRLEGEKDENHSTPSEAGIDLRVGMWALIDPKVKSDSGNKILPFISKIVSVDHSKNKINFNKNYIYHTNGETRVPSRYMGKPLEFAGFDWVKATSKNKADLINLNELRKMIRDIINELYQK